MEQSARRGTARTQNETASSLSHGIIGCAQSPFSHVVGSLALDGQSRAEAQINGRHRSAWTIPDPIGHKMRPSDWTEPTPLA